MADFALTVRKRDGVHKDSDQLPGNKVYGFNPENYTSYIGQENNGNWACMFYLRKDITAAANNDTVTLTLG